MYPFTLIAKSHSFAETEKDNISDKESVASKHSESGEKKVGKLEIESQTTERR